MWAGGREPNRCFGVITEQSLYEEGGEWEAVSTTILSRAANGAVVKTFWRGARKGEELSLRKRKDRYDEIGEWGGEREDDYTSSVRN